MAGGPVFFSEFAGEFVSDSPCPEPSSDNTRCGRSDDGQWTRVSWIRNLQDGHHAALRVENVRVEGGAVILTVPAGGPDSEVVEGGQILTVDRHFHYGLYEACIRPAAVAGVVNAFYYFANDARTAGQGFEIDIEFLTQTDRIQFTVHDSHGPHPVTVPYEALSIGGPGATYHAYAFYWPADRVEFLIDAEVVAKICASATTQACADMPDARWATDEIPAELGSILLNSWTGNQAFGGGPPTSEAQMRVDWVRYTPIN